MHWIAQAKLELAASALLATVIVGIGLLANEVTSPKVCAVMVYLSDWRMFGTWQWWTRVALYLGGSVAFWWWQKRKFKQQFDAMTTSYASTIAHLRSELRHAELLVSQQRTELAVLRK